MGWVPAGGRAIVVGAGLMGRHHASAIRRSGSAVVAIIDRDLDLARSVARRHAGAIATNDLEEALARTRPTIAHLCTPAESHRALAERLALAQLHTFIEKPFASSATETRLVLEEFSRVGKIACPVHQYAFQRSVEQAIASLPDLGSLRRIAIEIRSAGADSNPGTGDRVAGEIAPHPLSIIQRLLPSEDVGALNWTLHRAARGEWLANASSNGVLLSIAISMGGRPTRFTTVISGTGGTVELNNFHDYIVNQSGLVSRSAKISQPFAYAGRTLVNATGNLLKRAVRGESAYPGLRALTHQFHRAAESGVRTNAPITPSEIVAVATARDALLAQCREWSRG